MRRNLACPARGFSIQPLSSVSDRAVFVAVTRRRVPARGVLPAHAPASIDVIIGAGIRSS
jgi:hypothetical protein